MNWTDWADDHPLEAEAETNAGAVLGISPSGIDLTDPEEEG